MVTHYLIDSSIASKYLNGQLPTNGLDFMDTVFDFGSNISVITKIELLSWVIDEKSVFHQVEIFVENSTILGLTDDIIAKTIELRRKYKLKTPDAIIAATTLTHQLTLLTDNEKDFSNIKKLKYFNPNKI